MYSALVLSKPNHSKNTEIHRALLNKDNFLHNPSVRSADHLTVSSPLVNTYEDSIKPSLAKSSRWFSRPDRIWWNRRPRTSAANRRLFFSFNQMLLSFIAPRLMRYQFDLMIHSVVAELFRKIFMPAVTNASGDSNSIISSLGNLLRLRQHTPRTTTAAPTVDVQRLLDNANKLIALQSLMRNNRNNPTTPANNNPITQEHFANRSINQGTNKHRDHSTKMTDSQIDLQNSNQSEQPNVNTEQPIHLAISTKDFVNFLKNNLKQYQANFNSTAKNIVSQVEMSSNINQIKSTSLEHSHSESPIEEAKPIPSNDFQRVKGLKKNVLGSRHRTKTKDFKMSHLTFIDTEVPNYGNQLVVRDQDYSNGLKDIESGYESLEANKSQLGSIDASLLNEKEFNNVKSYDLERANRWNNVLVNMNVINESPNG